MLKSKLEKLNVNQWQKYSSMSYKDTCHRWYMYILWTLNYNTVLGLNMMRSIVTIACFAFIYMYINMLSLHKTTKQRN